MHTRGGGGGYGVVHTRGGVWGSAHQGGYGVVCIGNG